MDKVEAALMANSTLVLWEPLPNPRLQPYLKANELIARGCDPDTVSEEGLSRILRQKLELRPQQATFHTGHQSAPAQMETIRELSYESEPELDPQLSNIPTETVTIVAESAGQKEDAIPESKRTEAGLEKTTEVREGSTGLGNRLNEILETMHPVSELEKEESGRSQQAKEDPRIEELMKKIAQLSGEFGAQKGEVGAMSQSILALRGEMEAAKRLAEDARRAMDKSRAEERARTEAEVAQLKAEINELREETRSAVAAAAQTSEEQKSALERAIRDASCAQTARLDRDFAGFEKRFGAQIELALKESRDGIGDCRGQINRAVEESTKLSDRHTQVQIALAGSMTESKTGIAGLCEKQHATEQRTSAMIAEAEKKLTAAITELDTRFQAKTADLEGSLKFAKLDIADKFASIEKSALDVAGIKLSATKLEALLDTVDALKKSVTKITAKLSATTKEQRELKSSLAEKLSLQPPKKPEPTVDLTEAAKELERYRQKVESLQRKMREIDTSTAEANRTNRLSIESLTLQVKNLELARSLLKLEHTTTSKTAEKTASKRRVRLINAGRRASSSTAETAGMAKRGKENVTTLALKILAGERTKGTVVRFFNSSKVYQVESPFSVQNPENEDTPTQRRIKVVNTDTEPSKEEGQGKKVTLQTAQSYSNI